MNNFEYRRAGSFDEAISQLTAAKGTQVVAGGTNILDLLKYFLTSADTLVDINHTGSHQGITETESGGLRLGALATNADTAYHPLVGSRYPLLSRSILAGASAQIRNMATNGGNLLQRTRCYYFYDASSPCNKREPGTGCSAIPGYNRIMAILGTSEHCIAVYPSDMSVGLAALDAVVNVNGPQGVRSIPFPEFHRLPGETPHLDNNLQYGELITSIDLPQKGFSENYSYLKLRDRNSYAFALVSIATGLELDGDIITDARIALGGVAHKPWRNVEAEQFLTGKPAVRENFAACADIILQGAVPYKYNSFKIELAKRAIVRNCIMALDPSSQLPGAQPSV
ncbi:FAD binding domain-containing protein [Arcticibacter sp.]|uniref:FAD binding domain-containing protein n=1 Tax=Arcticibacter sp. TaxID=1872630 RepID=UPI00388F55B3